MKNLIIIIAILTFGCDNISAQKKEQKVKDSFVCSPCGGSCDTMEFDKAGKCPHCGMTLIRKSSLKIDKPKKKFQFVSIYKTMLRF